MKRKYVQTETGEKLSEELLCNVCIPFSVIHLFSYSVGETLFEKQVPSDIREHVDADGEKKNNFRQKLGRSFLGNYSVICVIISHR